MRTELISIDPPAMIFARINRLNQRDQHWALSIGLG
jgi:hypothetical protein